MQQRWLPRIPVHLGHLRILLLGHSMQRTRLSPHSQVPRVHYRRNSQMKMHSLQNHRIPIAFLHGFQLEFTICFNQISMIFLLLFCAITNLSQIWTYIPRCLQSEELRKWRGFRRKQRLPIWIPFCSLNECSNCLLKFWRKVCCFLEIWCCFDDSVECGSSFYTRLFTFTLENTKGQGWKKDRRFLRIIQWTHSGIIKRSPRDSRPFQFIFSSLYVILILGWRNDWMKCVGICIYHLVIHLLQLCLLAC